MKKKMYKKFVGLAGMTMVTLMCLTGCSQETPESTKLDTYPIVNDSTSNAGDKQQEQIQQEQITQGEQGKSDFYAGADLQGSSQEKPEQEDSDYFAEADLQGSVVEFSDSGFELSAAEVIKEDEGEVMVQAAPGAENEEDLITITYSSDVTFEIITMDSASLTEISREDTDKQSIKKQTSVLVFGNCQDTYHWTADKVIIMRWK